MSQDNKHQDWSLFLSGELDHEAEVALVDQLDGDRQAVSELLQDAEVDGLLRAIAFEKRGGEEQFARSVMDRLDTGRLPLKSKRYPDSAIAQRQSVVDRPPQSLPAKQIATDIVERTSMVDEIAVPVSLTSEPSDRKVWRYVVAPLAAVTLFAIVLTYVVEQTRVADKASPAESTGESAAAMSVQTDGITGEDEERSREIASMENRIAPFSGERPARDASPASDASRGDLNPSIPDRNIDSLAELDPADREIPDSIADAGQAKGTLDSEKDLASRDPIKIKSPAFASLIETTSDARWYRQPSATNAGQSLSLLSGSAVFQFASGADVTISAPADFVIDSENSLLLARGHVSANVPQRAIGFSVDTPSSRVVDLGTRFDLDVSALGTVSLRVLTGMVRMDSLDHSGEGLVLTEGQERFVAADGEVLDWMIDVDANVFGDIAISVNGQVVPFETADESSGIIDQTSLNSLLFGSQDGELKARYIFNGQIQELESTRPSELHAFVASQIEGLAEISRRGETGHGAYRVRDMQYPYAGLKDQAEVRKKVARIYGVRALGGHFSTHERFETSANNLTELKKLQDDLIKRLNYVDFGGPSRSNPRKLRSSDIKVAPSTATREDSEAEDATEDAVRFVREPKEERETLFRRLEEMKRRKAEPNSIESPAPVDQSSLKPRVETSIDIDDSPERGSQLEQKMDRIETDPTNLVAKVEQRGSSKLRRSQANKLVTLALEAELTGEQKRRQDLLESVLRDDPENPSANWQSGRLRLGKDWLEMKQIQERAESSPVLAVYERMRETSGETREGTLKLARWCRTRRPQAARMYYTRLLDDPKVTNPSVRNEAIKNLDLVLFQGGYVTRASMAKRTEMERRFELANRVWTPALNRWATWLRMQSREQHKASAIEEIAAVEDPAIALIARRYAGSGSEEFGLQVVDLMKRFTTPESTQCLAQFGVRTMWPKVRENSALELRDRKLHDYVPELLGSLIGMAQSEGKVETSLDGTIRFEHVFRQEGATTDREQRTNRTAEARVNFAPTITGSRVVGELTRLPDRGPFTGEGRRIERMFEAELARRDEVVERANAMARFSNQNVYSLLSKTTGQTLTNSTDAWWNWWQDHNYIQYEKSEQNYVDDDSFTYVALDYGPRFQRRHSCFAAGTMVATETGMRPIEGIVAGDRVLAKDVDTGELKLQTVLLTTVRPPSPLLELTIGNEKVRTTLGHPFWVTGNGWKMAKQLVAGDQLHGMHGVLQLEETRPLIDPEPVYNLVVDEFGNYFVGSSMTLVHDNTFRRPTPAVVPGLQVIALK